MRRIWVLKERRMDIYVGNLAYEVTDDDLRVAFAEHGQVASARVITDRFSGRSKGFGFVEMPDNSEAQVAITRPVLEERPAARIEGAALAGSAVSDLNRPYGCRIAHRSMMPPSSARRRTRRAGRQRAILPL